LKIAETVARPSEEFHGMSQPASPSDEVEFGVSATVNEVEETRVISMLLAQALNAMKLSSTPN
jgi:hypothetical protein